MVNVKVLSLCNDELSHTNHKCVAEHYTQGDMSVLHISIRDASGEICYEFHGTFVPVGAVDALVRMACDSFNAGIKEGLEIATTHVIQANLAADARMSK